MDIHKQYLILDEERNAVDYLIKSAQFSEKIRSDLKYLKWFTIAFHGAVYSFMLLKLQKTNSELIFDDRKTRSYPLDRQLISFKKAYNLLKDKNVLIKPYIPSGIQDSCIDELNDKLRNQMIHFRPTLWASEPWYFAEVSYPLVSFLRFCIEDVVFINTKKEKIESNLKRIESVLKKHI